MKRFSTILCTLTLYCSTFVHSKWAGAEPSNTTKKKDSVEKKTPAVTQALTEKQKAEFFYKAFGKKVPKTFHPHEMVLTLDHLTTTTIIVNINPYTQTVRFRKDTFVPFLEEHLLQEPLQPILEKHKKKNISEDFLRAQGFELNTDMKRQTIQLTSPLQLRKKVQIPVSRIQQGSTKPISGSQPISGYVNMSHSIKSDISRNVYNGYYNGNLNLQNWLLQSELFYDASSDKQLSITGLRTVKDWYEKGVRFTIGDNGSPSTDLFLERPPLASGFQQTFFGVDVIQVRGFNPMRNCSNDFSYNLVVEEESRVEIEINGNIVYQRIMMAGKYDFLNFPFQIGRNSIIFRQITRNGRQREEQLEYIFNPSLLQKGQREFQIASGLQYKDDFDIQNLDNEKFTNLLYYRYGISDNIGTSAYIQTVGNSYIFGGIGEYGLRSTIISLEMAHSKNQAQRTGQAIRLQTYSSNVNYFTDGPSIIPNFYTFNVHYNTPNFSQDPSTLQNEATNDLRSLLSPALIWQFTNCCQLQVSALVRDYREKENSKSIEVRSYYRTGRWQFDYTFEKSVDQNRDVLLFFTNATWWPQGKQYNRVNHRYNDNSKTHEVLANISPEKYKFLNYQWNSTYIDNKNSMHDATIRYQSIGRTFATRMNRSKIDGDGRGEFMIDYDGARSLIDLSHVRSKKLTPTTIIRLDTAVAFVGKHWGISRPINESFTVLYANNEGLKEGKIKFRDGSVLDKYSSAVFPMLGNYQTYEMDIHSADVPIGLDLGKQQYLLKSGLNSGQAIPIGKSGGILMASTTLLKPNGKPFDLEVGTFINVNDPTLQVQFFTNRSGTLFVQGLKSGDYRVKLLGDEYADFTLTIPKDVESPIYLDTITLKAKKK